MRSKAWSFDLDLILYLVRAWWIVLIHQIWQFHWLSRREAKKMPLGVVFTTSILDPEFCCKWKRILPEEEACVFSTFIQVLASIHTLIQLFTSRHTLIRLLTTLDDQITCYTHSMSHATTSITGRCQSSVECQKRGPAWQFQSPELLFSVFPVSGNVFLQLFAPG